MVAETFDVKIDYSNNKMLQEYSVTLAIDVETYQANSTLLNEFVKSDAQIKSIKWNKITKFDSDNEIFLDVSKEEMETVVYKNTTISIISNNCTKFFQNENGFTVEDLFDCVLDVEKIARPRTEWFGGIDAHHVYFEGLQEVSKGCYLVFWGS